MKPTASTTLPYAASFTLAPTPAPSTAPADRLHDAVEHLEVLLYHAALDVRREGRIGESTQRALRLRFREMAAVLDEAVRDTPDPRQQQQLGAWAQHKLIPYILKSDNARRWLSKPRGTAGDFLSIERIYRNEPGGDGPVGALLDRCFLDLPAAQAIRNRRGVLCRELARTALRRHGAMARVTSLACGPAQELFDAYAWLVRPEQLEATVVDADALALTFVDDYAVSLELRPHMTIVEAHVMQLVRGDRAIELPPQDLIYSAGLSDYLDDEHLIALLDYIHAHLAPGGRVVIGNLHPKNPTRAMMDHVLDWRLAYRSEQDMDRLWRASAFGRPCDEFRYEAEGINLFAIGVK